VSTNGGAAPQLPGARLLELVAVMDRLRIECPWDAKQTHESLAPFLLEETYEALEALESGDPAALREELGDVLLQVLFHARVAAERTDGTGYTIDDVADGIASKLVRRHPHVFGDVTVAGAGEVKQNWDAIKAAERAAAGGGPGSALDGVPFGQPALSLAAQLQRRARRAGIPAQLARPLDQADSGAQTGRELSSSPGTGQELSSSPGNDAGVRDASVRDAAVRDVGVRDVGVRDAGVRDAAPSEAAVSDLGARLFALAAEAADAGLDPELELRAAARAYAERVRSWERSRES
jgi:NTP pyrophosphatase (non-canonical NTP hydrolase)